MDSPMRDYLEIGLFILAVAAFVIWLIYDTVRTSRRNNVPVETDRATVYFKHPESEKTTVKTLRGYRNESICWVTFHTAHGEAVKLYMTEQNYIQIQENDAGMLTWQGARFWKFEPEKKEE